MPNVSVATDNFNRANNTSLGGNWTTAITGLSPQIVSNQVRGNSTSNDNFAYWSANSFDDDQYSQIVISGLGTTNYSGPIVHANGSDTIAVQCREGDPPEIFIWWYNGGGYTSIASSASHTWSANDELRLEVIGTTFYAYVNDSLIISGTNGSAPTSGNAGLVIYPVSNSTLDNWDGGNITADVAVVRHLGLLGVGT